MASRVFTMARFGSRSSLGCVVIMNAYMLSTEEGRAFAASLSVFNRAGMPGDVADIAAFLASPDSRWMTGQYVDATGGTLVN